MSEIRFNPSLIVFSVFVLILIAILQLWMMIEYQQHYSLVIPTFLICYSIILLCNVYDRIIIDNVVVIKKIFRSYEVSEIVEIKLICWGSIILIKTKCTERNISGFFHDFYKDFDKIVTQLQSNNINVITKKFSLFRWLTNQIKG